ncbi:MAG: histidine--tRNA ligase [Omnitrophica bacterium GWA2_52_8]|nr:MAG: histidine--tRNA ligase [Omnitrophica bacterium GWA2_52_8]
MEDILPGESEKWQWLEEQARIFFEVKGFSEIRTPLVEPTELFARSIGEATDIVNKEMYTFEDRGGRSLTLRPEMTASVARAVLQHNLLRDAGKSLWLYYIGPMFRAERPQAGRKRQFHQIGAELVNCGAGDSDFKSVGLLYEFLRFLGITGLKLRVNDLSQINGAQSPRILQALGDHFKRYESKLSADSANRLKKNVLRIFDSKDPQDQEAIEAAPWEKIAPLSDDFMAVTKRLEEKKIPFEINRRLVRGLDYYTGMVYEIVADGLGAQDALAGGGRYDRLYEELGGKSFPCTGFSVGMERLLIVLGLLDNFWARQLRQKSVYFAITEAHDGMNSRREEAALRLRRLGFRILPGSVETSLTKHLKKANQEMARFVAILGSRELKDGQWSVKDMLRHTQSCVPFSELADYLQGLV